MPDEPFRYSVTLDEMDDKALRQIMFNRRLSAAAVFRDALRDMAARLRQPEVR